MSKRISARLILLFVFTLSIAVSAQGSDNMRVINGSPGFTATYPWMGSITIMTEDYEGASGCGGSLISPSWVLTAAHCFLNETGDAVDDEAYYRTSVLLNSDTIDPEAEGSFSIYAARVIVHPDYNPDPNMSSNENNNDIALIELETPVSITPVLLMDEDESNVYDGTETVVMGWGSTAVNENNEGVEASNSLLQARQKIVSNEVCNTAYNGSITDNMICANAVLEGDTTDTCTGDSGGPMLVFTGNGYVQAGVVSFGGTPTGPACGDPDAPGVYARVSKYNDFIRQYATDARFVTVNPIQNTCAAGTLFEGLNIAVPCVLFNGVAFSTAFSTVDTESLIWQWNGWLGSSACNAASEQCAEIGADMSIMLPDISVNGNPFTVILDYSVDNSTAGKQVWKFRTLQ